MVELSGLCWMVVESGLVIRLRSEDPFLCLEALGVVEEEHTCLAWAAAVGFSFQALGVEMG